MIRFTNTVRFGARAALLLTIASGFLAVAPSAFAADEDGVPQATLNVAHTDFTSAKSVAHLKNHVRHTAYNICTADSDGRALMSMDQRQCYQTAMRTGMAQVENRRLAALSKTSPEMASAQPAERPAH